METAPLEKQVTHYKGLLWFRSTDDGVCFSLRPSVVKLALKSLTMVFRVTKPKVDAHVFEPFHVQVSMVENITLPLALPDLEEKPVPVSREWLVAIQPILVRAIYILDTRTGVNDFTLIYDGDEVVEVEVDRKSIPPQRE